MKRRDFLSVSAALAAGAIVPRIARSQQRIARFCDMHAHLGFRAPSYRDAMVSGDMLLVAEKITPDSPIVRLVGNRLASIREAAPGELRRIFEEQLQRRRRRIREEGIVEVTAIDSLERVLQQRTPAIAISAEGADFLEGDLAYVAYARGSCTCSSCTTTRSR